MMEIGNYASRIVRSFIRTALRGISEQFSLSLTAQARRGTRALSDNSSPTIFETSRVREILPVHDNNGSLSYVLVSGLAELDVILLEIILNIPIELLLVLVLTGLICLLTWGVSWSRRFFWYLRNVLSPQLLRSVTFSNHHVIRYISNDEVTMEELSSVARALFERVEAHSRSGAEFRRIEDDPNITQRVSGVEDRVVHRA